MEEPLPGPLEDMSQQEILLLVQADLGRIAVLRERISLSSSVLIRVHGVDIDQVLEERANETKITST